MLECVYVFNMHGPTLCPREFGRWLGVLTSWLKSTTFLQNNVEQMYGSVLNAREFG